MINNLNKISNLCYSIKIFVISKPTKLIFFPGRIDLPDAHNDAYWIRRDQNGSLDDSRRIHQEKVPR